MLLKIFTIVLLSLNNILSYGQNCYTPTDVFNKGLVSYENKVYDIKNYIHPGGQDTLKLSIGKPLEEFFNMNQYSFHITSNIVKKHLQNIYVGELYNICNVTNNQTENNINIFDHPEILYSTITYSLFILSLLSVFIIQKFNSNYFKKNINTCIYGYISLDIILFYILYMCWWISLLIHSFLTDDTIVKLGIWICLNMSFTLLPITRNSVWVILLKLSYVKLLLLHKLIAILTLFSVIIKLVTIIIIYTPNTLFNNISNIMGTVCTILIILMSFLSIPYIRKNIFELFYYSHRIISLLVIITMSLHYILCLYFIIPSIFLYILDIIFRISNTKNAIYSKIQNIEFENLNSSYIFITLTTDKEIKVYPGCYFFICCNDISHLEWHPLSFISNNNNNLVFCMKNMGKNSWSNKLKEYKNNKKIYDTLNVFLQGPYKHIELNYNSNKYEYILNITNGIGITPFFSILNDIYNLHIENKLSKLKKIVLIWIIPDIHILIPFINNFNPFKNLVDIHIYITKNSNISLTNNIIEENNFNIINNKPNIGNYIKNFIIEYNITNKKNISIITCGSPNLVQDVLDASSQFNIEVFNETFN